VGEAPAEKEKLGILVQQLDEVEVEALPTDMPEHIEVSVDGLAEVGASILVKDITIDPKIVIKSDPEAIVVQIEALAKEEPVEVPAAPAEGEVPVAEGETPPTAQGPEVEEKPE
jgi:large subunit ribosomal protein L25